MALELIEPLFDSRVFGISITYAITIDFALSEPANMKSTICIYPPAPAVP